MTVQIIACEQGSPEWFAARLAIPTASNFSAVMAKGEGKTRKAYMLRLLGERFTGTAAETFTNDHMERGKIMEDEARQAYAFLTDAEPLRVGFLRNGDKGCSPDSLIGARGLLEIKTALPHIQIERIFADKVPSEHLAQVQGAIWVGERDWCDFVSYWPKLPLFVKRAYRDEEYIKRLDEEVTRFLDEMHELGERLVKLGAAPAVLKAAA